jgi:S-disulfanyl-L-cysteine oxidoreductase SoxD
MIGCRSVDSRTRPLHNGYAMPAIHQLSDHMNRTQDFASMNTLRKVRTLLVPTAMAVVATIGIGSLAVERAAAAGQGGQKTVWDGVYTASQADARGRKEYLQYCAACHLEELQGEDLAPPLKGEDFLIRWSDQSVQDFVNRVQTTMPADAPGTLMPQQVVDITAYIFKWNKMMAGSDELKPDAESLKTITITKRR